MFSFLYKVGKEYRLDIRDNFNVSVGSLISMTMHATKHEARKYARERNATAWNY